MGPAAAGPAGVGTMLSDGPMAAPSDAWRQYEAGKAALAAGDYSSAVDTLSQALEALVAEAGGAQFDRSLGPVYLAYGRALCRLATERSGDSLFDAATLPSAPAVEEGDAKRPRLIEIPDFGDYDFSDDDQSENSQNDGESQEDAQDGSENEEEQDDFEIAWEVLDIARVVFSDATDDESRRMLADVHCELGDVAMETEQFGKAAEEFSKAADVLRCLGDAPRLLASAYFRAGTALDLASRPADALIPLSEARTIIRKRISALEAEDAESKEPAPVEGTGELSELRALLPELDAKIAEVTEASREGPGASLEQELRASVTSAAVSAATDLSSLVKRPKAD